MKKEMLKKTLAAALVTAVAAMTLAGCGSETAVSETAESTAEKTTVVETEVPMAETPVAEVPGAPYFKKGVYLNYAAEATDPPMTYFYVFSDDNYGYTADAQAEGIGVPFDVTQEDGKVKFSFGGADSTEDVLEVTALENGAVKGHFEDGLELVFVPVLDADPDTFDAVNYVNAANGVNEAVYNDANGWSVKYDPTKIEVVQEGTKVAFTYTGEGVGANSLLCYYDVDKTAKEARDEIAKGYGDDATTSDGVFPGTEDVPGYYATTAISAEGSGLYEQVFTRDYMDGYLVFMFTGHKSGDEAKDMEVSDVFAMIFDSISFNQ